jgi:hypothetical protein
MAQDGIDEQYAIHPNFSVPPAKVFKAFARWLVKSSTGLIREIPGHRNICGSLSMLFGGILKETQTRIAQEVIRDVHAVCELIRSYEVRR